jgi:general secretion pathway protein K
MTRSDSRRGMVLVTVLWLMSLLSALAMAASVTFRGFAGVMAVERDQIRTEALLTAGLETAAGIVQASNDSPLIELETTAILGTGAVHARLNDEGGRIDIGKAKLEVLVSLFRFAGAPEEAAAKVAQLIVKQRSLGGLTRPENGGRPSNEVPQPSSSNQPFTDLAQLHSIPEIKPEWIAAIAPLTTAFGDETVNPLTAPPSVIAALPGVDAQRLGEFLRARRSSPTDADRLGRVLGPAQQYVAVKPQRVASVDLTAELASGYAGTAHAVIVVLPQDSQPYRVLVWTPMPYKKGL